MASFTREGGKTHQLAATGDRLAVSEKGVVVLDLHRALFVAERGIISNRLAGLAALRPDAGQRSCGAPPLARHPQAKVCN